MSSEVTRRVHDLIARHGAEAVIGVLGPLLTAERKARIDVVLAARLRSVVAVMQDTYDPHNASAAIRTIAWVSLGKHDPPQPGPGRRNSGPIRVS